MSCLMDFSVRIGVGQRSYEELERKKPVHFRLLMLAVRTKFSA